VSAVYCGHDHANDYCGSLHGMRLAYGCVALLPDRRGVRQACAVREAALLASGTAGCNAPTPTHAPSKPRVQSRARSTLGRPPCAEEGPLDVLASPCRRVTGAAGYGDLPKGARVILLREGEDPAVSLCFCCPGGRACCCLFNRAASR